MFMPSILRVAIRASPWYAKALAIAVAGYALSPVDLIPDFIPLLGYLDDIILVPLGILLVIRLIPPQIMAEHRDRASRAGRRSVTWPQAPSWRSGLRPASPAPGCSFGTSHDDTPVRCRCYGLGTMFWPRGRGPLRQPPD